MMDQPIKIITGLFSALAFFAVLSGISLIGIRIIINRNNPNKRVDAMKGLYYIGIGALILAGCLTITNLLINLNKDIASAINSNGAISFVPSTIKIISNDGNFLTRAIAFVINGLVTAYQGLEGTIGFKRIDQLIFNNGVIDDLSPFSSQEWTTLNYIYSLIAGVCGIFLLIMVGKTGIDFIHSGLNIGKRVQLQDDIMRWFYCIFAIATAPVFVKALFILCNALTQVMYQLSGANIPNLSSSGYIQAIQTGDPLSDAIVKILFCYNEFMINLTFIARKIVLEVMYCFTPIAACLWGINRRINASVVWWGEMMTNATMQFFYAFVFFIMVMMVSAAAWSQWFYALVWMFSLIQLSEMLRNTLQGLFARASGVDEVGMGKKALGSVGKMLGGASSALSSAGKLSLGGVQAGTYGETNRFSGKGSGGGSTPGMSGVSTPPNMGGTPMSNPAMAMPGGMPTSSGGGTSNFGGEQKQMHPGKDPTNMKADDGFLGMINNVNRENKRGDVGKGVGNALDYLIGHDQNGSTIAKGVGNQISRGQRTFQTGVGIYKTTSEMAQGLMSADPNMSKYEATKTSLQNLMQTDKTASALFRSSRIMSNVGKGDYSNAQRLMVNWHPYTDANKFTWKN